MEHNNVDIRPYAEDIKDKISTALDAASSVIDQIPALKVGAQLLRNRASEYQSPAFLILVVGPVKSGKSTFVNLASNSYVSPTDFLECTVRPSLISSSTDTPSLTVYRTADRQERVGQIDSIFDCMRGLIEEGDIADVSRQKFDLTPENIKKYVALEMVHAHDDEILLTAIKTPGGRLLQDNVYIADMAGFDGAHVHLDETYRTIAQRADLIVFVQSSNSAISKVSKDFFMLLSENNKDVPVCLIHNIFDSAYWRNTNDNERDAQRQKDYAIDMIQRGFGFRLSPDYAFNINLGAVADYRTDRYTPEYKDRLAAEAEKFEDVERRIYELIVKDRESIRVKNCINRTRQQKEVYLETLEAEIESRRELFSRYGKATKDFDALLRQVDAENQVLPMSISIDALDKIVEDTYLRYNNMIKGRYRRAGVQTLLEDYMAEVSKKITEYVKGCTMPMELLRTAPDVTKWQQEVIHLSAQYGVQRTLTHINTGDMPIFEMSTPVGDIGRVLNSYVKENIFGYPETKVRELLSYVRSQYSSDKPSPSGATVPGYNEAVVLPAIKLHIQSLQDAYVNVVVDTINSDIRAIQGQVLTGLIPDIERFNKDLAKITTLRDDLIKVKIASLG